MRLLALVPARGGSKRLPGKNIRMLGGRPLIHWSIDTAKRMAAVCDILASTDDVAIAEAARSAGALVPWLRPAALATDAASSVDVALHALDWYENAFGKVDGLLLLQPTSPLRRESSMQRGVELFSKQRRSVLGVSPAKSHPMWCYHVSGGVMRPYLGAAEEHLVSQQLPPAYVVNGAFYLIAPDDFRKRRSFYGDGDVPLLMDSPEEGIDIDTEWDWKIAEMAVATRTPDALLP